MTDFRLTLKEELDKLPVTVTKNVEITEEMVEEEEEEEEGEEEEGEAEDRIIGLINTVKQVTMADLYSRVLCPTCIMQIIAINALSVISSLNSPKD